MAAATISGVAPILVRSLFFPESNVNEAMTGKPVYLAASTAIRASSVSLMVSTSIASGSIDAKALACSENDFETCWAETSPDIRTFPVGPMEANTRARPAAALLEMRTPARLISTRLSLGTPGMAIEVARNVLVRITWLPASTYARATSCTNS
jgi:hypothetical protein